VHARRHDRADKTQTPEGKGKEKEKEKEKQPATTLRDAQGEETNPRKWILPIHIRGHLQYSFLPLFPLFLMHSHSRSFG